TWANLPAPGDFTHMTLLITGGADGWEFFGVLLYHSPDGSLQLTQHHGSGFVAATVEGSPIDPAAITGPVVLRLAFDDATNVATTSVSLDGGATYQSPLTPTQIFDGHTTATLLLGADPQAAPAAVASCGNGRVEAGEQCDLGRQNGHG